MELTTTRASGARVPWRAVAVMVALALLAGLALVYVGSQQRRIPPPFGPAANGVIPFDRAGDIFVGDPVTGAESLVLGGPENDYGPTFSPDGTRIGFVREAPTGENVYVVDVDGENLRKVTPAPLQALVSATWTLGSDGFVLGHDVDGVQRLEVFDLAGGPQRLLLEGASVDHFMYRPPAGDEIMFRGRIDGTWGLYRMRPDGTDVRLLAVSEASRVLGGFPDQDLNFPAYSPDGSTIYYNRYVDRAETIQAWVMNADGSGQRRFNASGPACCWWEGEMAPSPDGKWVVMWRTSPSGTGEITLYPADGSGDGRVIGPYVPGTGTWAWAPDSTKLLLNYNVDAEGDQTLVDPVTGESAVAPWKDDATPDWQRQAMP